MNDGDKQTSSKSSMAKTWTTRNLITLGNYNDDTCNETDLTIYSEGLESAMNIMTTRIDAAKIDPLNCDTKRFIIFITTRSEFKSSPKSDPRKLNRILSTIPDNKTLIKVGSKGYLHSTRIPI